ncbi:CaiB/BaiF CoA transferase family protein [Brackiella oedipodis]|uniref:CaiB/BaiF CoA transferase family protein n=1 Tax=Brackiella oedipodis TaxID=124225 RepID=UPI00048DE626|nr:CaiB/BaiF CoA-transferase family protein [Brackiella oedipodis]
MSQAETSLPLEGVRVLDLSRVFAGPYCTQSLGDFGAEVIKIEHPERGDDTRDWGLKLDEGGITTYYNSVNRSKKSIGVNLKTPEGQALIKELVKKSHVLVHNFKYGDIDSMGLGYETLKEINPSLIFCAVTGYDPTGPEAKRPGYDLMIQGEAGLMALNGDRGQGPLKFGMSVVDMYTGMFAAQAIMAALYEQQKNGKGRLIEMVLYDSGVTIQAFYGLEAILLKREREKYGNQHPSIMPYGVYDAKDGPLIITVGNNAQFKRFAEHVLQMPELANNPDYETNLKRAKHRDALLALIKRELIKIPRAEVIRRLNEQNIPCGEVKGMYEALSSERTAQSDILNEFDEHTKRNLFMKAPYRYDGKRIPVHLPPPKLAEHTDAILSELTDYSAEKIAELKAKGAIK